MRYDAVFLDVDGTLLRVDLDIEGYVEDLSPFATNATLSVEKARGALQESFQTHISEHMAYATKDQLAEFRRQNIRKTADALGLDAPIEVLSEVLKKRTHFNPYPESEDVMEELTRMGLSLYVLSNWDVALESVLGNLGWTHYFSGIIASAAVGSEKPDEAIFREALRAAGVPRERVIHVGNDPISDIWGATSYGIDAVLVDRGGGAEAPEAVAIIPDLKKLPELVKG